MFELRDNIGKVKERRKTKMKVRLLIKAKITRKVFEKFDRYNKYIKNNKVIFIIIN